MAGTKKLVAVTLAVTMLAAAAAYLLRPTAGPNTDTVIVNEPPAPDGDDPAPDTDPGDEPTDTPPAAHGKAAQNSNGPKHEVCLPANPHVPIHAADEGANRYRGACLGFPAGIFGFLG